METLDAKVHIPAFSPQKLDLLKTWVGGGLKESRRAGAAGLFILCARLLGRRVPDSEPWMEIAAVAVPRTD